MKIIKSKFLTFLLCSLLVLTPSFTSQAKLEYLDDDHNAVDLENDLRYVDYPSLRNYFSTRDKILSEINPKWSTEEKLLYIHDCIVCNTEYDFELANSVDVNVRLRNAGAQAYGAIINHKAICQGYSSAFMDMAIAIGVPTIYVENSNHAWNAVQLNGKWYYVDCTWDDPMSDNGSFWGLCLHKNFLRNEAGMRKQNHNKTFYKNKLGKYDNIYVWLRDTSLDGKITSDTYENMNWHESMQPMVFLNDGVVYESSDGIYFYKCDGSEPIKVTSRPNSSPDEFGYSKLILSGQGDIFKVDYGKYTYQFTCTSKGVVAGPDPTNGEFFWTENGDVKKVRVKKYDYQDLLNNKDIVYDTIVELDNGVAYFNEQTEYIYFDKRDGSKAEKILDVHQLGKYQPGGYSYGYDGFMSGKGTTIIIYFKVADWSYNTKTGTLKVIRGPKSANNPEYVREVKEKMYLLPQNSKFSVKDLTYKVTGNKIVSVSKIEGTKVSIPATVKYKNVIYKVEGIEKNAASKGKIKTLTIGKNVKTIGQNAFYKCPVQKITIKSTVLKSVGKNAFSVKGTPKTKVTAKYLKKYKNLLTKAGYPKKGTISK